MFDRTINHKPQTTGNARRALLASLAPLVFLFFFCAFVPAARAAITEQDIPSLTQPAPSTSATTARSAPPADLSLSWLLGKMALSLGIVFGLMWLVLWAAKRYIPQATGKAARGGGLIEILATRSIGQRRSLMLVRAQGKTLLLGVTPQAIQTLAEMEPEAEITNWQDATLQAGLPPEPPPPARGSFI